MYNTITNHQDAPVSKMENNNFYEEDTTRHDCVECGKVFSCGNKNQNGEWFCEECYKDDSEVSTHFFCVCCLKHYDLEERWCIPEFRSGVNTDEKLWCDLCYKDNRKAYNQDYRELYKMKMDETTTREEWDKMTAHMTEKYAMWGFIAPLFNQK